MIFLSLSEARRKCGISVFACGLLWSGSAHAQTPAAPPSAPVIAAPATVPAAQNNSVSIGPGLFTFPQIAALLSLADQPITCDASLNDRAAFVYLINRPRDETMQLLSAGLQVEFVPDTQTKTLTMVRQKAVSEREAQWLKRLARILQNETQKQINGIVAKSNGPLPNRQKVAEMQAEVDAINKEIGYDESTAPKDENTAQKRKRRQDLFAAQNAENAVPSGGVRMTAAWAQANPVSFASVLQGKKETVILGTLPPQGVENNWAKAAIAEELKIPTGISLSVLPVGFSPENYLWSGQYSVSSLLPSEINVYLHTKWQHQRTPESAAALVAARKTLSDFNQTPDETLTETQKKEKENATAIYYLANGNRFGGRAMIQSRLPEDTTAIPKGMPAAIFLLGTDAMNWWKQEKADTDTVLPALPADAPASPHSSAPKNPDLSREMLLGYSAHSATLSDAAAAFFPKNHVEAIMEMHPRAEYWQNNQVAETAPAFSDWIKKEYVPEQWTVRQQNKVFLITNRLAFVERPQNAPLSAWVELHNGLQNWHEKNDMALKAENGVKAAKLTVEYPPYEPLGAYANAAMARRDSRTWVILEHENTAYHGITFDTLDNDVPVVYLWNQLSQTDREKIRTRLRTKAHTSKAPFIYTLYPLSKISGATLAAITRFLREAHPNVVQTRLPASDTEVIKQLRACNLAVYLRNTPDTTLLNYDNLALRIESPKEYPDFNINSWAQFLLPIPPDANVTAPTP